MNVVRPLLTVIILAAIAVFLFWKINEAPLRHSETKLEPAGAPPLAAGPALDPPASTGATAPASSSTARLAPQWPGANTPSTPSTPGSSPNKSPEMPTLPDLPDLPGMPEIAKGGPAAPPLGNPGNTPGSRYSTDPPSSPGGDVLSGLTGPSKSDRDNPATATKAAPVSDQDAADNAMRAIGLTPGRSEPAADPADNRYGAATAPPAATGAASPRSDTTTVVPSADNRYGAAPNATSAAPAGPNATSAAGASAGQSFAASWPAIQSALDRGDLARAHKMLSPWYGDPTLSAVEGERVETLLGQLAGTVIYSTEHRLEPPYTVKPGESLESIAKQLDVPWQLLAKINGVASPSQIRPGQQLKVIRGPFAAVVDLRRNQLALMVDGRYAGRFQVSAQQAANMPSGEWVVLDKPATPAAATSVYSTPAAATVSRSIMLRSAAATPTNPGSPVMIGSTAAADSRAGSPFLVKVSPRDADELSDILSIGSRVIIQR